MSDTTRAAEGSRRVVQRGLWFEEFEVGTTYEHRPGRTVTEADNVLFTTLTMNTQPLHLDAHESGQQPPFHERLVNSMFTFSTLVGLSVSQLTLGTIVANLGCSIPLLALCILVVLDIRRSRRRRTPQAVGSDRPPEDADGRA